MESIRIPSQIAVDCKSVHFWLGCGAFRQQRMNFQGMRFFPYLQFEQPSVLRPPTHLNPNIVRIIESTQNNGCSLTKNEHLCFYICGSTHILPHALQALTPGPRGQNILRNCVPWKAIQGHSGSGACTYASQCSRFNIIQHTHTHVNPSNPSKYSASRNKK